MANCKAMALLINQLMSAVALKEDIMVGHKLVSIHVVSGRTLIDCPGWTMHACLMLLLLNAWKIAKCTNNLSICDDC